MPRGQSNPGGPRVAFPLAALAPSLREEWHYSHGPPPDSPRTQPPVCSRRGSEESRACRMTAGDSGATTRPHAPAPTA